MSLNDSVIELGQGTLPSDQELHSSIPLPTSVPKDESFLIDPVELTGLTTAPISSKGDKYYIHTQLVASDVWTISHNLQKHPAIHIEDLNGEEIIAEIIYVTNNIARVYFGEPYVGTAHCN